ncbi:endonuclease III domain-containing protein [Massiliimalia massiliensis]|jgi:endonuclease-3|uniref:endonuclease III domain-containing protein n=1 Tax=Massiliimalia massiliensis TaxID=1852384 RepID=UPI000987161D|nr:endonuclease III [Massiliimalia massiliensis]
MTKKERALLAIERLKGLYPEAVCSLTYKHPYELLISTRLSAQCTDARVNIVTEVLFEKYPTLESLAHAEYDDIEQIVRPCGLGKTKARDIIMMSNQLIDNYNGVVPDTIEELLKLSGIGRKTANLVVGDVYGKPSIVTDTHCIRICGRLGLTDGSTVPLAVENQLRKILPPEEGGDFCHRLVHFGREWCMARNPRCEACPLSDICKNKTKNDKRKGR